MRDGHRRAASGSFRFAATRRWDDDPAVGGSAVGRVLVLGDIHDNARVFAAAATAAARAGCDAIVSVGDFWLQDSTWSGWNPDHGALMAVAVDSPIPVVVVDGNHEVWPSLQAYLAVPAHAAQLEAGRPLHLGGSLWWAHRGTAWTWHRSRCGALGGAVTPARQWIHRGVDRRWPDAEATTPADLARLLANAPDGLDVLFCHDAPSGVSVLRPTLRAPLALQAAGNDVRRLLQAAVDETRPHVVLHGHWHYAYHEHITPGADVFGLAADGRRGTFAYLDTRNRTVTRSLKPA